MKIIKCNKCGKNFGYEDTGNPWPGGKDREEVRCPYSGEVAFTKMISGFIYTYKLDENGNKI